MGSVQDHAPVVRELSERRQHDPQPSQTEQPRPTQTPPKARDLSDPPRLAVTSETQREPSPPRFSQLLEHLPETTGSTSRRGPSTATTPATLVNHPGILSNTGGAQNISMIQDRNHAQSTSLAPDRRPPTLYDSVRGESAIQVQLSDDGEHDRRATTRRVSIPLPRPVFSPLQGGNGNGNGNGSRVALRAVSGFDPHQPQQPGPKTVEERLRKTHEAATSERNKYKRKARQQSVLINGAIGLQVVVGAITTGVAAGSKNIGTSVAVLGGISTTLASYLAKARGSGEPEFSTLRARELSTFLRELDAFIMDHGYKTGPEFDARIAIYRERFELIIKTEGEDSTSGTGYAPNARSGHLANFQPMGQQGMVGSFDGRGYQTMPLHMDGGNGQLSEKQQMLRNEKALSGMV